MRRDNRDGRSLNPCRIGSEAWNDNYKTGQFTCEAIKERSQVVIWIKSMGQLA